MNGSPLPAANGYPMRLIVPGWYGVAYVKWLTRIDVLDKRYLGRFMGRRLAGSCSVMAAIRSKGWPGGRR
jgi:DMSO/TMAO reductase YedYZ molybdopterin-dependent catalytic subunit